MYMYMYKYIYIFSGIFSPFAHGITNPKSYHQKNMIEIFNPHSSCSIGSTKQPQFKWISQSKCNTFLLFQTNFRMCSDS